MTDERVERWVAATLDNARRPEDLDQAETERHVANLSDRELREHTYLALNALINGDQRGLVFPRGTSPIDRYGTQNGQQTFAANEGGSRPLLESQHRAEYLWWVTASGDNVQFELLWGTASNLRVANLRSPLAVALSGNISLQCSQVDVTQAAIAQATMTIAGSRGTTEARQVVTALGALLPFTRRVTALAASTVTVAGTAVALAAGASLDVANPAALTVGGPIVAELSL